MLNDELEELAPTIKSKQEQIQGTELLNTNMMVEADNQQNLILELDEKLAIQSNQETFNVKNEKRQLG